MLKKKKKIVHYFMPNGNKSQTMSVVSCDNFIMTAKNSGCCTIDTTDLVFEEANPAIYLNERH